jgi:hypothetical protein
LLNATVADNGIGVGGPGGSFGRRKGASGAGGGLFVESSSAADETKLQNTIVASSVGSGCAGTTPSAIVSGGHNLSYGDTTCPGGNGNPDLGGLRNNGGPTATLALGSGSAAIDRVPTTGAHCPSTDQRGVRRRDGSACDIGAFEVTAPTIDVISPRPRGFYGLHSRIVVHFRCSEGGIASPIATCQGLVSRGHAFTTRATGKNSFTVTATDRTGTTVTKTVHFTVWPYTNPLRLVRGLYPGRIDMGVDYAGSGPLLALGNGRVTKASNHDSGWPGGGVVVYRLSKGPFAGKYVYVTENIRVRVRRGQRVKLGEQIATLHRSFPHMETGWAAGDRDRTLATVDGHDCPCGDPGGWSTIEGRNFDHLLMLLGAPSGYLQPNPPKQTMPPGWPRPRSRGTASIPQSATPLAEGWTAGSP